jgi:DNA-binding Lrp family transcriptional regulator
MLSNSLGYRFIDRDSILERLKAAGHKWEKWTEGFDEHAPRVWEKYDWSYLGFVAVLQSTIMDEAASGNVVIMGRGGNYLLKGVPFALCVRIVAPVDERVARLCRYQGIDAESARRLIEKTDRERAGFLLTVYGRDGRDPTDYDLVFDSAAISIDRICAAITEIIAEKDRLQDETSLHRFKMRALAADMKARLLTTLPFFLPTLEVEFDGQAICIRGVVRLPNERDLVIRESRKIGAEAPLRFDLRYRR